MCSSLEKQHIKEFIIIIIVRALLCRCTFYCHRPFRKFRSFVCSCKLQSTSHTTRSFLCRCTFHWHRPLWQHSQCSASQDHTTSSGLGQCWRSRHNFDQFHHLEVPVGSGIPSVAVDFLCWWETLTELIQGRQPLIMVELAGETCLWKLPSVRVPHLPPPPLPPPTPPPPSSPSLSLSSQPKGLYIPWTLK